MAHTIRTWNVFHGNAWPPRRRSYLRPAVALAVADDPSVVCLQELPVWAVPRLEGWTGYRAFAEVARRGVPPAGAAGWVTRRWQGLLRSAIAGQANAILVRADLAASAEGSAQVSEGRRERRVVHAVRVQEVGLVATTHLSHRDADAATAELRRATALLERLGRPGERLVLAGDLNLEGPDLPLPDGWSGGGPGIDHVLVRVDGDAAGRQERWPVERRRHNAVVLSDHAPVDRLLA